MWNEIKDQTGIDELMRLFGYFHDSCLRDVYITTSEFVDKDLSMHSGNTITALLLFQRQIQINSVLEMRFDGLQHFNFHPLESDEHSVIYDATLIKKDKLFYWSDFTEWTIDDNDSIWLSGQKLYWRFRPELIGNMIRIEIA